MKATLLLAIAAVLALHLVGAPALVAAENTPQVRAADTIRSMLERQAGQRVELMLQSGEILQGTVTTVGQHVMHLSRLAKRSFFDAVVRLEAIDAVILRVRNK